MAIISESLAMNWPDPSKLAGYTLKSLVFGTLLWIIVSYGRVLYLRSRMPPGPFPLPILGNIGQLSPIKPHITYEEWSRYYNSSLITIWTGNRPAVIINDVWSASELMDKRANIYSTRPHSYLSGDMFESTENNQTDLVYGDKWRLHRRLTHSAVGSQVVRGYRTFQGNESKILAHDILQGRDFVPAIERYACSVAAIVGWGRRVQSMEDDLAKLALSFVQTGASLATPAQHLAEAYPWLLKLPSWIYPLPTLLHTEGQKLMKYFYALTVEGAQFPEDSFSRRLLQEQEQNDLSYKEIASLTGNLIGGGVDTTTTTIIIFIFAMCIFPRVQRKAQEEIDRVLAGEERVPDWADEDSLPYCKALLTEIFRWRSAIATGGPAHAPTEDDIYKGYLIPAGTTVMGNLWAMHRNPRDYPSPDEVRPERFLDERVPNPGKRGIFTFGWGRRVCSGQPLAEQGIFFTIVELLWAFRMRSIDDEGNDKPLNVFDFNDASAPRPLPFKVEFTPRSDKIEQLVRQEAMRAEAELQKYNIQSKITIDNIDYES